MPELPSNASFAELLPRDLTNTIGRLEFLARSAKEGTVTGRHTSPHKGFSVEFAEHRQYVAGDDLRDLDWRVYGKSDRYYIKQYIEETNMRVTLLVDASGSMAYTGDEATELNGHRLSKFAYARHLAASLAYLFIRQQDAVGLVTFDDTVRRHIRPVAKPSQVRLILDELMRTAPADDTRCAETFHDIAERIPARGLVIVLSDLFDDAEAIKNALHHFRYKRHEILVFHLMAEEELTFPFKKFDHFKCLEIENLRLNVEPQTIRVQYLERVRAHLKALELACGQMQADYVPVNTKVPVTETLLTYFARRKALSKR
ncbi:MAG: DUF58 domain-containing protein [Verrucomicrobiae bacterium]|nr:DUF58 domain-containing protein [Verrucomicrobiae bacterium]MCP5540156.1 DUF58 domain-containing protein [Akkermansiaceae bacterium]